MSMSKLIPSIFFLFSFLMLKSQSISGRILGLDKNHNLLVSISNQTINYNTKVDASGRFFFNKIHNGTYKLIFSSQNKNIYNEEIIIAGKDVEKIIQLDKNTRLIDEVIIEKKAKVIQSNFDKIIFNVKESIYSNGFDASEVLSKVPMVKVDNEGVGILNRGKVLLLINGRMTYYEGNELINYLKNIPSNTISKIELNTNPSSNYDAQGSVGIINIITKKDFNNILNVGYTTSFTKRKGEGFLNGINFNYNKKSLQFTSRLNYNDQRQVNNSNSLLTKNGEFFNESNLEQNIKTLGKSFFSSINYTISPKFDIGIDADVRSSDIDNITENLLNYDDTVLNNRKNSSSTFNIYSTYKLDSLGKKVDVSGTYFLNKNNILQTINNGLPNENNKFEYRILSAQSDLTLPFKNKLEILAGVKATLVKNEQNYLYEQTYRDSNFDESIYAIYTSVSKEISKKIYAKAGMRYENYKNKFLNILNQEVYNTNKNSFFPSAYVDYEMNENNKISLSYSRRINRPNFRYLDPFKTYFTDRYYQTGNPNLSAFFTTNIELKYSYKDLNILLFNTKNKNMFSSITKIEGINQVKTFDNFFDLTTSGINMRYSFNKIKNIETNLMTNISYSNVKILNDSFLPRRGIIFYYYIDNNIYLNKEKTFFFNFSFLHSFPTNSINSYLGNVANFSGGFKLFLMQKKMQLNLTFNDLFKQQRDKGIYYYDGYNNTIYDYRDVRSITLGFTYSVGKAKVKSNKNTVYERNRTD